MINQWLAFRHLERKMQEDIETALSKASYVMSLNEFHVLYFLKESEGHKLQVSEISEKIGLSISATSRMLVRFENTCGVIERHTCADDKRGIEITLTRLGQKRLAEALQQVESVLAHYQTILENISKK